MAPGVIGRDDELAVLRAFLAAGAESPRALVLMGEPGIGKTALWEAGMETAQEQGVRVLFTRSSQGEAQLSFAALNDLLDGIEDEVLRALPAPQRRAVEVALLRDEPGGLPPEPRAIAAGFLQIVRVLASRCPLLVAIDDVQWLDAASSGILTFAARRIRTEAVRFLLTERPRDQSPLTRAFDSTSLLQVQVHALSFGAVRRLLADRLGLVVPRRTMRRIFETTRGNPLFAFEVGRILVERGATALDAHLPLPAAVEDLLGGRVAQLPGPMRRALLAVAFSADLRESQLAAIADPAAIDDARDAGLLVLDGDRLRTSHPLLAEAARTGARASERRALHLDLARVAGDEGVRARHLALAASRPDDGLATTVAAAAAAANARGARQDAVELAMHALRLTPADSGQRMSRLLEYADYLHGVGDYRRLRALLIPEVNRLPAGAGRARAHLLLIHGAPDQAEFDEHLEQALSESDDDLALRATVLAEKALDTAVAHLERLHDAETWAADALSQSPSSADALQALGWVRILRGAAIDDLMDRESTGASTPMLVNASIQRLAGIRHAFRGEADAAREIFVRLLALADARGEEWSYGSMYLQLCELDLRVGDCLAAQHRLDDWDVAGDELSISNLTNLPRCMALLAAERGQPEAAEKWATHAIAGTEKNEMRWDQLEAQRAIGIAALFAGQPRKAADSLRAVWGHTEREGIDEPGAFPAAPDLVEALVALGQVDEATAVTERLSRLARAQVHPWGLASAKRSRALVRLASEPADEEAFAGLAEAASAYGELGLRFDHARSLLILGRFQRRARRWGDARRTLEQAHAAFEAAGALGWADQARSELGRIGARRPAAAGTLTTAEERVVTLAAEGRSNKEIAHALSVGVHTVEVQLSHAYAKLGVQSRAQLARHLAAGSSPKP
ncbi:MAG TPA: AAA family ATPase [Candidatus Limnocylindrales bacterium]|nr:AAA family ATPase [Candidatus Limnocylindrales bacterium]